MASAGSLSAARRSLAFGDAIEGGGGFAGVDEVDIAAGGATAGGGFGPNAGGNAGGSFQAGGGGFQGGTGGFGGAPPPAEPPKDDKADEWKDRADRLPLRDQRHDGHAGALRQAQRNFIAQRNARFGKPGYDLQLALQERLGALEDAVR